MPATGLRRRRTFQIWRDDLRVVPKDFSSDGTSLCKNLRLGRRRPVPPASRGVCSPKNCSGRRDACEDLGIAADTAASTPKIKHRTSVRVHWFISDCKTKREADWQVIMDEQAL